MEKMCTFVEKICSMKKVFSAWLLDIAKYIVTALVITSALSDIVSGWFFYTACFVLVAVIIVFGILLYKGGEKEEKKRKEEKNQNS